MSDNYKVIRQTREAVKELKSQGWSNAKIASKINIVHGMVQDLIDLDEVALNVREATLIKFRKFLDERSPVKKEPEITDQKYSEAAPPVEPWSPVLKPLVMTDDLLAWLDTLIAEFNERGYRLDVVIHKIYKPDSYENG